MKILLIILLGFISHPLYLQGWENHEKPRFVILITSYNNQSFLFENLQSACFQQSTYPYHIIYVNDASTDKTGEMVDAYRRDNNLESLITVIHNKKNVGALKNYYDVIHTLISDDEIVVNLDGDDMLAHNEVLLRLESVYSDPEVWMASGLCVAYPFGSCGRLASCTWVRNYTPQEIKHNLFRKSRYSMHHLRTFRAALFKKIRLESFLYEGSFFRYSGELAFMFPMIEMCRPYTKNGTFHYRFIHEVLYYWRIDNPLNDFRAHRKSQSKLAKFIKRKLKPYKPLESLNNALQN